MSIMKNKLKISILGLLFFSGIAIAQGQQLKIGYISSEEIINQMPEYKAMTNQLKTLGEKYENEIKKLNTEFDTKFKKYESESNTMSQEINRQRGEELQSIRQKIQEKQVEATQAIQKKEQELLRPIFDKAQKAIEDVAKANGYDFILEYKALLYHGANNNILNLVKSKLGIK